MLYLFKRCCNYTETHPQELAVDIKWNFRLNFISSIKYLNKIKTVCHAKIIFATFKMFLLINSLTFNSKLPEYKAFGIKQARKRDDLDDLVG